jgi:hypothetical protein
MLIEFRVENYRSLRDEQVLSMEAAKLGDADDPRLRAVPGAPRRLLTVAAIYGANASGKSNVLGALKAMKLFITNSQAMAAMPWIMARAPFGWGEVRRLPSLFEAVVVIDGTRYQFGFVVSDSRVEEEWLFAWPERRKQTWYVREQDSYRFGDRFKGENQLISGVTREKALFLSAAAQHKHPGVRPVFDYFSSAGIGNAPSGSTRRWMHPQHEMVFFDDVPSVVRGRILPLLKDADLGIVDVRAEESEIGHIWDTSGKGYSIEFRHDPDDGGSWLSLDQESQGTQTLFHHAGSLLQALDLGTFMLFDELDSRLHPAMAERIVQMFNDPRTNPRNAQLIFTTHNTNLLGNTMGEPALRRDQVWFTEKERDGATRLFPLSGYKVRKLENVERGYLQGRYGAVPILGNLAGIEE